MAKKSGGLQADVRQNICGPQIRQLRQATPGDKGRGLSLEEMAARMEDVGVSMSPAQLSKIETQKKPLLDIQLLAAAAVLNVEICALFAQRSSHGGTED